MTTVVLEDDLALPVLDAIRACLCTELESSPGGETCFCGIIPGGGTVPADWCNCKGTAAGCGQAWVRAALIFPYAAYPQQNTTAACNSGLAMQVELGVLRCLPTLNAAGAGPSAVQQAGAVQVQLGDWQAMRRVLACCEALSRREVVLGTYIPRSQGGCGGGTLTATVMLGRHLG